LVVHLNAGIAGLVAAYVLGPRRGYGNENLAPYDLSLAVIGTGLLWVGWLGFNGGSALGAGPRAGHASVATHLAASAGVLTWMFLEWWDRGKPSVLGMISGAIAGLGTITPASGFVAPWHGVVIGIVAGGICYWGCIKLKQKIGYDDSLDVFGVHGIGGATGTILAGVFAVAAIGEKPGLLEGNSAQLLTQLYGVVVTLIAARRIAAVGAQHISAANGPVHRGPVLFEAAEIAAQNMGSKRLPCGGLANPFANAAAAHVLTTPHHLELRKNNAVTDA
jgi:Amt family ammonium transporter